MSILNTSRLLLRTFDYDLQSDYDNIITLYNSPFMIKYNGDHGYYTNDDVIKKDAAIYIDPALCTGKTPCPKSTTFLVHLKSTGQFIGAVDLAHRRPMVPDIGYNFLEEFVGQGYGTEACREILRFWQEDVGVKEIWIGTFPTNIRSQKVALKLGFIPGGMVVGRMPATSELGSVDITAFILPTMDPFPDRFSFDLMPN